MTEYEYDDAGRLVRSVTATEPEWDEQERAWMLALASYEAALCPNCGRPVSVCSDPNSENLWRSDAPTRCFAATAVLRSQERYSDPKKTPHGRALSFTAYRTDRG